MKKIFILSLFIVFFSCSKIDNISKDQHDNNQQQVIEMCNNYLNNIFPETKSAGQRTASLETIYRAIKSTGGQPATRSAGEEWIPLHVVNFKYSNGDNAGFAVMTDDQRVENQYFAYSDCNNWYADSLGHFKEMFLYLVDTYIENSISQNPEVALTRANRPICNKIRELKNSTTTTKECKSGVLWGQTAPYNNMCPKCSTCGVNRAVTGCTATAVAQIMAYHQKPTSSTLKSYTAPGIFMAYNWPQMKAQPDAALIAPQYQEMIAHIMAVIGRETFTEFNCELHGGSGSNILMAESCLQSVGGYNNMQFKETYNLNDIKTSLNIDRPILMCGTDAFNAGHAWVVEGYQQINETWTLGEKCEGSAPNTYLSYKTEYNLYFNLGWGVNNGSGYYSSGLYNLTGGDYTYNINYLTNIY